ncbi:Uma2 family endonuclease [Rhodopila sp.]|uniref:Uma2 family endonuclease n=1 Tax=Rhodopila sp. TaxID=2480087 RepID=UPI003D11403F
MSRTDYRRWAEAQPNERFERIEGHPVAMAPERASHADRKALVWLALHRAVAAAAVPCHVYPDGMTVEVDDNDFEPDATLRCGDPLPGDAITVPDPLLVVEVLSPATRQGDLTRKLVSYFRVPSIRHYLIFWADRPQVIHHRRRDEDDGIETRVLTAGPIKLDPPGIGITVEEVYAG